MTNWLITGGHGYLGQHVQDALNISSENIPRAIHSPSRQSLELPTRGGNGDDLSAFARAIAEIAPEVIIHLAGRTPPGSAADMFEANTTSAACLLEALRLIGKPVRVVLAGSAAELGPVPEAALPVAEDWPCRPRTAYGLSKLMATAAGLAMSPPIEVVIARLFNPIGPGASDRQAFGRFARLLADNGDGLGSNGGSVRLTVGDLDARRDFLDVRDAASALIHLAERGRAGLIYHIGSGESLRVGDGLEELIRLSGKCAEIATDLNRVDPQAPRDSRADSRRIREHTGWSPRISWKRSLGDLWEEAKGRQDRPSESVPKSA